MIRYRTLLFGPIVDSNPITLQILGICSALAVTTSVATALTMGASLTIVLMISNGIISLVRNHLPASVRLIVQITIVASLVIVLDQLLNAYAYEISQRLSIFVGLIVTNCLVLGRIETFAMRNPPWPSMVDGLGNGLGYSAVLLVVGSVREFFGAGSFLGVKIFVFQPLSVLLLAPSAFFILGFLVWFIRKIKPAQVERNEFHASVPTREGGM
ncbi:MAG: NADH:ubiquinone reductase (Na(+)-transporting) subunit D [Hyphomicrobiales bacterium]|nr:NADH:ubiquinone reductase (Na(+)-transporting) subunit D [Hyphomicrobiales bacterium]